MPQLLAGIGLPCAGQVRRVRGRIGATTGAWSAIQEMSLDEP